uniref:Uncharacterized protein n=1 Tax=Chelydra serpentina TaxID=8475 RepID=A0A8C3SE35_CHESE
HFTNPRTWGKSLSPPVLIPFPHFTADCQVIVNVHCRVLSLTAHLKKKCQCRPEDCIDLLAESGTLINLSEVESPASELASKYLQERQRYILIRVIRGEDSESTYYESLLENLGKHHPELAGESWSPMHQIPIGRPVL